ncbi:MAG: hypothetical protein AMS25_07075 [Gemmatimonas sp. SM23_52]|nr:MAG: hypothetical protein AMS25_07075 [Gemmatimonas sp. SM23_52]
MRKTWMIVPAFVCAALIVGCSKAPEAEIQAANAALDSARLAEASEYAPQALTQAEDAMAALEAELKVQEGRFGFFRSYDEAKQKANDAQAAAETALADAKVAREQARTDAANAIEQARSLIREASELLTAAPTGKGTAVDVAALRADLQAAAATLVEAEAAQSAAQYKVANAKATAALTGAQTVKTAVETATQMRRASSRS